MENVLTTAKIRNINGFFVHPSYTLEKKLLREMKLGLLDESMATLDIINETERAQLANNEIRSLKNSLIISCALFARAAIDAHVTSEDVFTLSDTFIQKIESLSDSESLRVFEYKMVHDYIRLINQNTTHDYSLPVTTVIHYINNHLASNLHVNDLAKIVHKSPDYLSKIFKKEVGETLTNYILLQKLELAKHFLEFTQMKVIDIAVVLSFCNQGYFSSTFKRFTGMTPSEYRLKRD